MNCCTCTTIVIILVAIGYFIINVPEEDVIVDVNFNGWWSNKPAHLAANDVTVRPFKVEVQEEILVELKDRLNRIRNYRTLEGAGWEYGIDAKYVISLVDYWKNVYDWRIHEKIINSFEQYKTTIQGIDIHFVHAKPTNVIDNVKVTTNVILIIHGWPGSFYEFYKIIPLLVGKGYHVIAPSIPGFGFSDAADKPGLGIIETASIFIQLMDRLGYTKYYVQGGDWGAAVAQVIAVNDTRHCRGMHTNFVLMQAPNPILTYGIGSFFPALVVPNPAERKRLYPVMELAIKLLHEIGHFILQSTKPDTPGFALNDSPIGLAAYIVEKFVRWSGCSDMTRPDCIDKFTKDELLTNVMIYWITQSITSSMRYYKELLSSQEEIQSAKALVLIPAGIADYPHELHRPPRSWLNYRFKQIVTYNTMPSGGHFAALEKPGLFVDDLINFIVKTETLYAEGKVKTLSP